MDIAIWWGEEPDDKLPFAVRTYLSSLYCIVSEFAGDVRSVSDGYAEDRFDAVLVAAPREGRGPMERQLGALGIPALTEEDVLESLSALVLPHLVDEESRDLFQSRLRMVLTGDEDAFMRTIVAYSEGRRYGMWELLDPMERNGCSRVILFGEGADCRLNRAALDLCGIRVAAVCALRPDVDDPSVIAPAQLGEERFTDCLVVVSSSGQRDEIRRVLAAIGFPPERVYDPPSSWRPLLSGLRDGQYFDIFKPAAHEVFVDCGAYNGLTLQAFYEWCGGEYDAAYAFEPFQDVQEHLARRTRAMHDVTICPMAVGERVGSLPFAVGDYPSSSHAVEPGIEADASASVPCTTIDDAIPGRISFLKMDIEGSELSAINGAERSIRTWRPRLAIALYHEPTDVLDIPLRILELVPSYRFVIRHYGTGLYETILYGFDEPDFQLVDVPLDSPGSSPNSSSDSLPG